MREILSGSRGIVLQGALLASVVVAFLSIISFLVIPIATEPHADMYIEPARGSVKIGEVFTVQVMVHSIVPVNVFKGEIAFDPAVLSVEAIDYNTSIADLWAEKPWYENGAGTINFIGGTTVAGGFYGTGALVTITFRAYTLGDAVVRMHEERILAHDGLGTDVPLSEPIDSIFAVEEVQLAKETIALPKSTTASIAVVAEFPRTDLNKDGKQTIADVSIFMLGMFGSDSLLDFNTDGAVDTKDLSIIMSAR